jgi:hypothetical protein
LFKIKPPAPLPARRVYRPEGKAYAPEGHAKKITKGICLIFRGLFFQHNPREIGSAFHRAGAEIGQKDHLWIDTNYD